MIQLLKSHYKLVEYYLYNYQQFKEEIETAKEDMYYSKKKSIAQYTNNVGYISNPTEQAVINYEKHYGRIEKWLKCIDKTIDILKKENSLKYRLLKLRYFENKRYEDIIDELDIEIATYYRWKDEIVNLILMIAIQEKLIKVYEH